jgi:hypothetical protein
VQKGVRCRGPYQLVRLDAVCIEDEHKKVKVSTRYLAKDIFPVLIVDHSHSTHKWLQDNLEGAACPGSVKRLRCRGEVEERTIQ